MNPNPHSNLTMGFAKQKGCIRKMATPKRLGGLLLFVLLCDMQWTLIWFPKRFDHRIFNANDAPETDAPVLILGNSVTKSGEPGKRLQERLSAGKDLWIAKKANKLILSGDGRSRYYNEPRTMANWMKSQGVPEAALVQDAEGTRTRESIDRLKNYYKINRVIVVTSKSHIVRALYLCDGFGVESIGVVPAVEDVGFLQKLYALVYEYFAIHRAFIEQALTLENQIEND